MISYQEFCLNCEKLFERVSKACDSCSRNLNSVKILPVTKTHSVEAAFYAFQRGFLNVGENKVQEAISKIPLAPESLNWELIGHLQSNKAKLAVQNFARIQSVDSEKLLNKLNANAFEIGKVQRVLLQINAGADPAKFGADAEDAEKLFVCAKDCKNISVEGLMAIAPLDSDLSIARKCFANLRNIKEKLESAYKISLPELSMGMTGDLECAIEEGSTIIRVGTALFGTR